MGFSNLNTYVYKIIIIIYKSHLNDGRYNKTMRPTHLYTRIILRTGFIMVFDKRVLSAVNFEKSSTDFRTGKRGRCFKEIGTAVHVERT